MNDRNFHLYVRLTNALMNDFVDSEADRSTQNRQEMQIAQRVHDAVEAFGDRNPQFEAVPTCRRKYQTA
jgi:hypothetical protein